MPPHVQNVASVEHIAVLVVYPPQTAEVSSDHANLIGSAIRDDQIEEAIPIKVSGDHGTRIFSARHGFSRTQTIRTAPVETDLLQPRNQDHDVRETIPVEVSSGHFSEPVAKGDVFNVEKDLFGVAAVEG